MLDFFLDRYIKSETFKNRAESFIKRSGAVLCGIIVARFAQRLGFDPVAFTEHFNALIGLVAAGLVQLAIELYAAYRAKVKAKALEVAIDASAGALTPVEAKTIAKAELKAQKAA